MNPPSSSPGIKSRGHLFLLKNIMAASVFVVSLGLTAFIAAFSGILQMGHRFEFLEQFYLRYGLVLDILSMIGAIVVLLKYERPIRLALSLKYQRADIPDDLLTLARKRLLNEPFYILLFGIVIWIAGAVIYTLGLRSIGTDWLTIRLDLADGANALVICLVFGFFVFEQELQWLLAPILFPEGGLHQIRGVKRISLRVRLLAMLFAICLVPLGTIVRSQMRVSYADLSPLDSYLTLSDAIWFIWPIAVFVGVMLILMVSGSLSHSVNGLVEVLNQVTLGNYRSRVKVSTNDELGYVGEVVNEMCQGLEEREQMRADLDLAKQVQQSLLPRKAPVLTWLDAAGLSATCAEIGGDYFDYIRPGKDGHRRVSLVVGDVSGHGVPSALLMTTARAFLRQRADHSGNPAGILSDVNRLLALDVGESGQFMTLFYLEMDADRGKMTWVSAGHDPAIIYDPATDTFQELRSRGLALGIDEGFPYRQTEQNIVPGQIIVITTDGVWEAHNPQGEQFGKRRVRDIIRANASRSALEIIEAVMLEQEAFCQTRRPEDDVTMVVARILG